MKKLALSLAVILLAGCSYLPDTSGVGSGVADALDITPHLNPYRIDVRQGNMVTQEMVAQLKLGQTKDQVRFILGTPLLTDLFHRNRWDYVYRLQAGDGTVQQRRVVVFFENDRLVGVGGDVVDDFLASSKEPSKPATRVIEIKAPEGAAAPDGAATEAAPASAPQ